MADLTEQARQPLPVLTDVHTAQWTQPAKDQYRDELKLAMDEVSRSLMDLSKSKKSSQSGYYLSSLLGNESHSGRVVAIACF